jgi:hypothetical protein
VLISALDAVAGTSQAEFHANFLISSSLMLSTMNAHRPVLSTVVAIRTNYSQHAAVHATMLALLFSAAFFVMLLTTPQLLWAQSEMLPSSSWQASSGPFGGNVKSFSTARDNIFSVTSAGGIFRWNRFNARWQAVNNGLQTLNIDAVYADPNSSNVYAVSNFVNQFYASADNGDTWQPLGIVAGPDKVVSSIASVGGIILTSTGNGLYRSGDGGRSFDYVAIPDSVGASNPPEPGTPRPSIVANYVASIGNTFFAGMARGLLRSTDFGRTWEPVLTTQRQIINRDTRTLNVSGQRIVAGMVRGAFISNDAGASWTALNTSTAGIGANQMVIAGQFVMARLTSNNSLVRTGVIGGEWQPVSSFVLPPNERLDCLGALGTDFLAGGGFGVSRSTDVGLTWASSNSGLTAQAVSTLFTRGTRVLAGTTAGIFYSSDRGATWQTATGFASTSVTAFAEAPRASIAASTSALATPVTPVAPASTFLAATDVGIMRSADEGQTWELLPQLRDAQLLSLTADNANVYAGTFEMGIFRSADGGTTWRQVSGARITDPVRSMVANSSRILATHGTNVVLSSDGGARWTTVLPGSDGVLAVAVAQRGRVAYAIRRTLQPTLGSLAGVYRSLDSGFTWDRMNTTFPSSRVKSILTAGSLLYLGTDEGTFVSTDSAATWQTFALGIPPRTVVTSFAVTDNALPGNSTIIAGTDAQGTFRTMTAVSVRLASTLQQSGGKLFPNPAHDVVTVEVPLPLASAAMRTLLLRVLDHTGAVRIERSDSRSSVGMFRATLDISSLPSGSYFVEVLDGEQRFVEKIVKKDW